MGHPPTGGRLHDGAVPVHAREGRGHDEPAGQGMTRGSGWR